MRAKHFLFGAFVCFVALNVLMAWNRFPSEAKAKPILMTTPPSTMLLAKKVLEPIPPDPDPRSIDPPDRKAELADGFHKAYAEPLTPSDVSKWQYSVTIDAYQKDGGKIEYRLQSRGHLPHDDAPLSPYVIARAGLWLVDHCLPPDQSTTATVPSCPKPQRPAPAE